MDDDTPDNPGSVPLTAQDKANETRAESQAARQRRFLTALSVCPQVGPAARAAGVCRRVVYDWLRDDEFRVKFDEAKQDANELLEQVAWTRATTGENVGLKWYQDQPLLDPRKDPNGPDPWYYERERSDQVLMFLMRANLPKYRDVSKLEVGGTGTPIGLGIDDGTRQTLASLLADPAIRAKLIEEGERAAKGEGANGEPPRGLLA